MWGNGGGGETMPFSYRFFGFLLIACFGCRFQASGDDLPVAPPAPAHAQAAIQAAQAQAQQPRNFDLGGADYEDGQYDPRYNDPSFSGNARSAQAPQYQQQYQQPQPQQPQYTQQPQPQYNQQPQQFAPQPQPQPQQPQYNNVNYVSQYPSTTQNPARFQPPGKLSLSRTADGFSYSFNKV